jgi:hypothetical protein
MMHAWEGSPCPSSASHRPAAVRSARKRVAQDSLQGSYLANILNCRIGSLLMKYLGLYLHWKRPSNHDWQKLIEKIQHKLTIWQGKQLSLRGRLVLLNSMLSAISMYYISLFRNWVLMKIDHIRKWFLWDGCLQPL